MNFDIDPTPRRLVLAWLADSYPDGGSESSAEEYVPRPPRLGLGAKYIPHNSAPTSAADRRLAGALRKQREVQDAQTAETENVRVDEAESRAVAVAKSHQQKRKRGRPRKYPRKDTNETKPSPVVKKPKVVQPVEEPASSDDDFAKVSRGGASAGNAGSRSGGDNGSSASSWQPRGNGQWRGGPGKRKKIRSRQKNLRRDTRSKEELPTHLTEDTLRGGRIYGEPANAGDSGGVQPHKYSQF